MDVRNFIQNEIGLATIVSHFNQGIIETDPFAFDKEGNEITFGLSFELSEDNEKVLIYNVFGPDYINIPGHGTLKDMLPAEIEKELAAIVQENSEKWYNFYDHSPYKKQHDKTIACVKNQIGIDLNTYRDGNGKSPFTTTYWDINGPKVAVNRKKIPLNALQKLRLLSEKWHNFTFEQGGSWFYYAELSEEEE